MAFSERLGTDSKDTEKQRMAAIEHLRTRVKALTWNREVGQAVYFLGDEKAIGVRRTKVEEKGFFGRSRMVEIAEIWGFDVRDIESLPIALQPVRFKLEGNIDDPILLITPAEEIESLVLMMRGDWQIPEREAEDRGLVI